MKRIVKATLEDASLIAQIGKTSWIESHGSSATSNDVESYVSQKYTKEAISDQLKNTANQYHLIYCDNKPAGYSNLILNAKDPNITDSNIAELDRLYLLSEFYNRKAGLELLNFNIELAKQHDQKCLWLYVWKGNERALSFYVKFGFKIIGSHDFKISDSHYNPNHQMMLAL